jgi:predicted RNA-binding protein with PIN domain
MNLIGSRPDRWWNDPDRAVWRLVDELDEYAAHQDGDLTVVFDRRPADLEPGRHGSINVAFASRRGRNAADHEIVEMLERDPDAASATVVTSDRSLADRVRALGSSVMSSGSFRRRLDEGATAKGDQPLG